MKALKVLLTAGAGAALTMLLSGCCCWCPQGCWITRAAMPCEEVPAYPTAPSYTASPTEVDCVEAPAPPQPRAEGVPPIPGPGYVWVNGHWDWTGTQYTWVPGYWAQPPAGATRWVAPRYERRGNAYVYYRGYWE